MSRAPDGAVDPRVTDVRSIADLVTAGAVSPSDVLEDFLARIARVEPAVLAFSLLDAAGARRQAEILTTEAASGRLRGPLHGVPVGVKDEFDVAGMPTAMRGAGAPEAARDATCVARLRAAGAVIVGKTTMPLGGHPPPTRNPWNLEHTPGGTSSGSAAAVAARMVPFAVAEQTAGSTLRPAAYCGVVGFKPSYGAISRYGCYPFTWSRDHVGLIGASVADVALVYDVLAASDPRDPTAVPMAVPPSLLDAGSGVPPRIGVVADLLSDRVAASMRAAVADVANRLGRAGAAADTVTLPADFGVVWPVADLLDAERAALLAGRSSPRDALNRQRVAGLVPAAYYVQAQRLRTWLAVRVHALLRGYDALLMPAANGGAPRGLDGTGDSAVLVPWGVLGLPAVTLNAGVDGSGLPLGVQFVAGARQDGALLRTAAWSEGVLGKPSAPEVPGETLEDTAPRASGGALTDRAERAGVAVDF